MTKIQRRCAALVVTLAIGIFMLGTGIMDMDWMAMQWHGNYDNGPYWGFIPDFFVMPWIWAYYFTLTRLVVGSMLCTFCTTVFLMMVSKRIFLV